MEDDPGAGGQRSRPRRAQVGPLRLSEEAAHQLQACVHCGFCLPACPTYRELGDEADSPRGRIDIIGALAGGTVAGTAPDAGQHLDRCLDCRACESACPSGVQYHLLYEEAVAQLPERRPWMAGGGAEAADFAAAQGLVRRGLRHLMHRPRLLHFMLRAGRALGFLRSRLPAGIAALWPGLPVPPQRPARSRLPEVLPARGAKRGEVTLFLGCIQDAVLGDDNVAMASVLSACGYEVHIPRRQTCCGALHVHGGDRGALVRLAARNLRALAGDRPVVLGAAGCGAVLKEYGRLLGGTLLAEQGAALAARVHDFAELLAGAGELPPGMPPAGSPVRVTWHDPCHLAHGQGVRGAPRAILRALPGVEYVELEEADACCGSAGVYNLVQPELSGRILERKVACVLASGARWVVTENPGCALQLRAGLAQAGSTVRVLSLGQVLDEVYGGEAG